MGKKRKIGKFHCKSEAQKKAIAASYARKDAKNNAVKSKQIKASFVMRLAKIRNRYLFKSDNPSGEHTYAVYIDTLSNETRVIPTTHLYVPDKKNTDKLNKGLLRKVKFVGYETPSGVNNYYICKDIKGNKIDLNHCDVMLDKTSLPQKQALIIKDFARYERK